jgi:hypothetical protein
VPPDTVQYKEKWRKVLAPTAGILAAIAAIATIGALLLDPPTNNLAASGKPAWALVALVLWAVVPPMWFWLEHFYVWRGAGIADTFDLHKYGQEVSRNIWLAFVALLAALYFK